ncbi:MAG: peptide deformylase [Clostridia bacterium]|jgi:peptide deformylase|nr:peptide deformylase [Clostridia bacterium]
MAVYQIVKKGDEILREKARTIKEITPNVLKLLDNMRDTMYAAKGVGLAAPQIGVSKRAIVVDTGEDLLELINPEITESAGEQTDSEGCLSIPGFVGEVTRAFRVKVRALNREGREIELEREEIAARALQHEIDHLNGILFTDKAENIKPVE